MHPDPLTVDVPLTAPQAAGAVFGGTGPGPPRLGVTSDDPGLPSHLTP
jgi:hypothetical protein